MNDDDLDLRLREYADRWRAAQTPAPMPTLVRRRMPRRVVPVAAAASAALVAAGVTYGVSRHNSAARPAIQPVDLRGTVPWEPLPPPPPYLPPDQRAVPLPPANARPCSAADVRLTNSGGDGASGHLIEWWAFRNISSSPCLLKGYPTVRGIRRGKPDVFATHGTYIPGGKQTANLAPGQSAILPIESYSYDRCREDLTPPPRAVTVDEVVIDLPGGGSKTILAERDATCEFAIDKFFVQQQYVKLPNPLAGLRARLELPARARSGRTLVYVTDLTNTADHPVELPAACLGYLETLRPDAPPARSQTMPDKSAGPPRQADSQTFVKQPYGLNCFSVQSMASGQTVRYEMRMTVPVDAAPGRYSVGWFVDGVDMPGVSAGLDVVSP